MRTTFTKSILLALLFCSALIAQAEDFVQLRVKTLKNPAPGYYYISQANSDSLGLMDNSGVFTIKAPSELSLTFYPISSNESVAFGGISRAFQIYDNKLSPLRLLSGVGEFGADFHECIKLSNGNYMLLLQESRVMDLSTITVGGNPNATVIGAVIQEVTPSGQLVWTWKSLDYIPVSQATEDIDFAQSSIDYIHVNSIWEESDGTILISGRHTDAVYKVNRSTKNIVWTLGGAKAKANDFTFQNDKIGSTTGFSHQHSISRRSNGNLLMFDNGNLRDSVYSRLVEYEINESTKTVKSVRVIRHSPDIFTPSMGSVQELPNGNFLIGWGNNMHGNVATEYSSNGVVQVEIENPNVKQVASYKVTKSTMSLNYSTKTVTSASTVTFSNADSTTNIKYVLSSVSKTSTVNVEKHYYQPHNITYKNGVTGPCITLPVRWVLRNSEVSTLTGNTTIDVKSLANVQFPELVKFYNRANEGDGDFELLSSTYSSATGLATINSVVNGELMIGYEACSVSAIKFPATNAVDVAVNPTIKFTPCLQRNGYELQISTSSAFTQDVTTYNTNVEELVPTTLSYGVKYYVRVRGLIGAESTPWSATATFRTSITTPQPIRPLGENDTARVASNVTFEWTASQGAQFYKLLVKERPSGEVYLDTVISGTSVTRIMPQAKLYNWEVRGIVDTVKGKASTQVIFYVFPDKPTLLVPANLATNVSYELPQLMWKVLPDIANYDLEVVVPPDTAVWHSAIVPAATYVLPPLPPNRSFRWRVRGRGKYGNGPYSDVFTATTSDLATIGAPTGVSPAQGVVTDSTNITFVWRKISAATSYQLQITSGSVVQPIVDKFDIRDTTFTVPSLPSGTVLRWRVRAAGYDRTSVWSEALQFTTQSKAPDFLQPVSPISGSTNVPLSGQFVFRGNARYSTYEVHLATSSLFDNAVVLPAGTSTSVVYSDLMPNTQYYWRAFGRTNAAVSDSGEIAWFATQKTSSVNSNEENSTVNIQHNQNLLSIKSTQQDFTNTDIVVRNVQGALVSLRELLVSTSELQYSTASLAPGVYAVTVVSPNAAPIFFSFIQTQ